jgi:hypothetical protein
MFKKYFSLLVVLLLLNINTATAEVCFTDEEVVDIVTLLDASERDIVLLDSCEKLVKELYVEVEQRDVIVEDLTKQLITAKEDVIKYQESADTWKKYTIYTSLGAAVIIIVELLPKFL